MKEEILEWDDYIERSSIQSLFIMGSWCVFSTVLAWWPSVCMLWFIFLWRLGSFGAWFGDASSYGGDISVNSQAYELLACMVLCLFRLIEVGIKSRGSVFYLSRWFGLHVHGIRLLLSYILSGCGLKIQVVCDCGEAWVFFIGSNAFWLMCGWFFFCWSLGGV